MREIYAGVSFAEHVYREQVVLHWNVVFTYKASESFTPQRKHAERRGNVCVRMRVLHRSSILIR